MVKLTYHLESLCATVLMTSQVLEHYLSGTRVTQAIPTAVFLPSKDIYMISSTCRLEIISREEIIGHSSLDPVAGVENREIVSNSRSGSTVLKWQLGIEIDLDLFVMTVKLQSCYVC